MQGERGGDLRGVMIVLVEPVCGADGCRGLTFELAGGHHSFNTTYQFNTTSRNTLQAAPSQRLSPSTPGPKGRSST